MGQNKGALCPGFVDCGSNIFIILNYEVSTVKNFIFSGFSRISYGGKANRF